MTLVKDIITPTEADATLALEAAWLLLTDQVKEDHIAKASVYMQTVWTCEDVDYTDDTTFTDDFKEACAYYSLADSNGNLYDSPADTLSGLGDIIETSDKVGSLSTTVKYDDNGQATKADLLSYPNALMGAECVSVSGSGSKKAVRT